MEVFGALGNRRLIRVAALEHDRLDQGFENKYGASRVPVADVPELPARHVEATPLVSRQQTALRLLARKILQDGTGFPQHIVAILQRRNPHVGIESTGLLRLLVSAPLLCTKH